MNKELLKERIAEIRELLANKDMHEAYNKLISLNELNPDIDNFTVYFTNSLDVYFEESEEYFDFDVDEEMGTILVEAVLGGYIPAKPRDIEDTLEEIEKAYLVS